MCVGQYRSIGEFPSALDFNIMPMVFKATKTPEDQWEMYLKDLQDYSRGHLDGIAETLKKKQKYRVK